MDNLDVVNSNQLWTSTITILVNGKIQYFIKGNRVKPQEYYRFRSEFGLKKNV